MSCALCGYRTSGGFALCRGCAINAACSVSRCPHCGYRFVEESMIVNWLRRLWRQLRAPASAGAGSRDS